MTQSPICLRLADSMDCGNFHRPNTYMLLCRKDCSLHRNNSRHILTGCNGMSLARWCSLARCTLKLTQEPICLPLVSSHFHQAVEAWHKISGTAWQSMDTQKAWHSMDKMACFQTYVWQFACLMWWPWLSTVGGSSSLLFSKGCCIPWNHRLNYPIYNKGPRSRGWWKTRNYVNLFL